jgi:hypothetical protein
MVRAKKRYTRKELDKEKLDFICEIIIFLANNKFPEHKHNKDFTMEWCEETKLWRLLCTTENASPLLNYYEGDDFDPILVTIADSIDGFWDWENSYTATLEFDKPLKDIIF